MLDLFGEKLNRKNLRKYIGDISQIAGAKELEFISGKSKGTKAIEVKNGSGLSFTILPDRGMDIAYFEYKGIPLSYISKTDIVSPSYYQKGGFLRSFNAGLLTTCGLENIGPDCIADNEEFAMHGTISNTPAYDVGIVQEWLNDDEFEIKVRGKVSQTKVFGENLVLTRVIQIKLGENKIRISDEVENCGFNKIPIMLLYHFNFGYPLVCKDTKLETNCMNVRPRDLEAKKGIKNCSTFQNPMHNYKEQVFYYDSVENSFASLYNPNLSLGIKIEFDNKQLPYLIEWKQMGEVDYVVGLEPSTWYPEGRLAAAKKGELKFIKPQEVLTFNTEVSVCDN